MPRFFFTGQPVDGRLTLTGADAHHAGRVLRLCPGEALTLCDGACTEYSCVVETAGKDAVVCRVVSACRADTEPRQQITLFMALPKGDKMEFVIQKAVELGVCDIVPYLARHCVSRPDRAERKVERWQKVALEAAKQCGRGRLPTVHPVVPIAEAVARAAESETALFCYENERETGLRDALAGGIGRTVSLMIGPEGGFAPDEAAAAREAGLTSVSLGTRILRCETAPVAALAAILYAGGNM